jgi:hypothetical protein
MAYWREQQSAYARRLLKSATARPSQNRQNQSRPRCESLLDVCFRNPIFRLIAINEQGVPIGSVCPWVNRIFDLHLVPIREYLRFVVHAVANIDVTFFWVCFHSVSIAHSTGGNHPFSPSPRIEPLDTVKLSITHLHTNVRSREASKIRVSEGL